MADCEAMSKLLRTVMLAATMGGISSGPRTRHYLFGGHGMSSTGSGGKQPRYEPVYENGKRVRRPKSARRLKLRRTRGWHC